MEKRRPIRTFFDLMSEVKKEPKKTIAIAAAHTGAVLDAAINAWKEGIASSLLIGNKKYILAYLRKNNISGDAFEIIDTGDDVEQAAKIAVQSIHEGKAHLILKGICDTGTLLKAVLNRESGLRTGNIMSDVLVCETPGKLILMGDGGFIPLPNMNEKISILNNCVQVAHRLGIEKPRAALLTHTEKYNPRIPSTVDAKNITDLFKSGKLGISNCIVEGPLALDLAISSEAAKIKGVKSEVAGNADILIVPNIESGNIFGKSLIFYCKFKVAHVVLGAKVPVLIASRSADAATKLRTMALGIICS